MTIDDVEHNDAHRPVVLVIDDDAEAHALVARAAGAEGFGVMEAPTGRGGLAMLRARPVDVVWGQGAWRHDVTVTVTEHVRTLRRKLREPVAAPRWIVTVRGVGYRFDP